MKLRGGSGAAGWRLTWPAVVFLALGMAVLAPAQPAPDSPAPVRKPEIRLMDPVRDAAALARLESVRGRLPEKYRRRNNFAWAVAQIAGLEKVEYFAHSGIQSLHDVSAAAAEDVAGISLRKKKGGRFEVLCVNHDDEIEGADCWPRNMDTEYKIIEDLAARLADPAAAGRMRLYTDLYPCASCRHVIEQFLAVYTNVQVQVLYREK